MYPGYIETIPEEIIFLDKLETILIMDNKLKYLPKSIWYLPNLRNLEIQRNELTSLTDPSGLPLDNDEKISVNLEELVINNSKLKLLPDFIGNLEKLKNISINLTELTSLPNTIGNLSNLINLNLLGNKLEYLPPTIGAPGNLSNLKILNLSDNKLEFLPESIKNLSNLQSLLVDSNELKYLPESIVHLRELKKLNVNNNKLEYLPEDIGKLSGLLVFNMYGNNITSLPKSIKKLLANTNIGAEPDVMEKINKIKKEKGINTYNKFQYIFKNIEAKYFDPNKNEYLFSDVNKINNLSDKRCSYCKEEPITSYSKYKNNEAHFVCSQNCSDKIFHNLSN
jgi:Leucine-rich repeat (LRR) protein